MMLGIRLKGYTSHRTVAGAERTEIENLEEKTDSFSGNVSQYPVICQSIARK